MNRIATIAWEIGACLTGAAIVGTGVYLYATRKRPTPEELELARRRLLVETGRIVDGTLLEVREMDGSDGRPLTLLLYSYRIGGVDYECSQDISVLSSVIDLRQIRAGFPCSVRYQPGSPQNSIVFAESWSGMRMGLPAQPPFERPEPVQMRPIRSDQVRPQAGT